MTNIPKSIEVNKVDVWFQDEARVGQKGTATRTWARKGSRPRLLRQQQFEYAYIFGAVCPKKNQAVGLVMPRANTEAMLEHLKEISAMPTGRHAVLVLDRAAWHTTKRINIYENITIIPLPPASPELNPVEQIWQMLRDNKLSNRCFEGYESILEACCEAWNWFVDKPNQINRLCTRSWAYL